MLALRVSHSQHSMSTAMLSLHACKHVDRRSLGVPISRGGNVGRKSVISAVPRNGGTVEGGDILIDSDIGHLFRKLAESK